MGQSISRIRVNLSIQVLININHNFTGIVTILNLQPQLWKHILMGECNTILSTYKYKVWDSIALTQRFFVEYGESSG